MLGVEFDPPDNIRKIKLAFEQWKKRLADEQNTTVDNVRLAKIKEELAMSDTIATIIDNPKLRAHEADELKRQRVEQLRLYIDLLRGDTAGTLIVTQAQMKRVREKLRLSLLTIEATYREQGFDVKKPRTKTTIVNALDKFFMSDDVMNEIAKNLADFNTVPDPRNYPWAASVRNLYDLAFRIEHTEPNVDAYRKLSSQELSEIFKREAQRVTAPVPVWHSIKALLNVAQMQVFNSDDNRFRYDHSLKLDILAKFFAGLKAAPDIFKRDPYFADNCIKRIQNAFPNFLTYELSVAIYNKAAGLLNDPYESASNPNETMFSVFCSNCSTHAQFRTREAAENSVCPTCGQPFFIDCPICKKRLPSSAERCPACGAPIAEIHSLPQKVAEMNEYISAIENEYRSAIENARKVDENAKFLMKSLTKMLADAKALKPDDPAIKRLETRFNNLTLMNTKLEQLAWAKSKMPSMSATPEKAVRDCMEILSVPALKNYRPAIERLRLIRPKKPLAITADFIKAPPPKTATASIAEKISINGKFTAQALLLNCQIFWQPDTDLGVHYQLLRKNGGIPVNNKDGKVLVDKTIKLEYEDKNLKAGVLYGYSVFAVRAGAVSSPASCQVVYYAGLDQNSFSATTDEGVCNFNWALPSDACLGVRITRADNEGNSVIIADCVQAPFVDRAVKNRKQYHYRLQCVYLDATAERRTFDRDKFFAGERALMGGVDGNKTEIEKSDDGYEYSEALTVTLKPELPPTTLKNVSHAINGSHVTFNWQSEGDFDVLFFDVNDLDSKKEPTLGRLFDIKRLDAILDNAELLARANSQTSACDFTMPADVTKIAVVCANQTRALINSIETAASVEPCEIDRDRSAIVDGKLKLYLRPLPSNIGRIHYSFNTKSTPHGMYSTITDAKQNHMRTITREKYLQDKFILIPSVPTAEVYITVIGEFKLSDGTTVYSNPSRFMINNRPKSVINYWLEWGTSGVFKKKPTAKNCKLIIESTADYTPTLYLAYNRGGGLNIEPGSASTITLHTIKGYDEGLPDGRLEFFLPDSTWDRVLSGTMIKLLPIKRDEKYFDVLPVKPETLKVPSK